MMLFLSSLISILMLGIASGILQEEFCQKDIEDVLAECTKKHLDESMTVPKNIRDLNTKCTSFKEAGLCLKNYAYRCMDEDSRIRTGLILSGITLVGGAFCGSQKDKEEFLQHTNCLNSTSGREVQCRKSFMQVLRVTKYVRSDMKVPVSCCYYNEFTKCLDSLFLEAGSRCSLATHDYFKEMGSKFRTNTMDMLCGSKYNRMSEKCDVIVGNPISGRDVIIKYLIGVFASNDHSSPSSNSDRRGFTPTYLHNNHHHNLA